MRLAESFERGPAEWHAAADSRGVLIDRICAAWDRLEDATAGTETTHQRLAALELETAVGDLVRHERSVQARREGKP